MTEPVTAVDVAQAHATILPAEVFREHAADEIARLRHQCDQLAMALVHRTLWSGSDCQCDEDPCPGLSS